MSDFGKNEVIKLTECTYRQLDYWTRQGYVKVSEDTKQTPGSGNDRRWDGHETDVIRVAVILIKWGLEPKVAFETTRALLREGFVTISNFPGVYLQIDGIASTL